LLSGPWLLLKPYSPSSSTLSPRLLTHALSSTFSAINEKELPIILQSVNPSIPGSEPIIAQIQGAEGDRQGPATTPTELAIKAQQYTKKVEVPAEYQQFAKVFSEEDSKQYPPKRAWDHAIEFKKDAPEVIDCKVYPMN